MFLRKALLFIPFIAAMDAAAETADACNTLDSTKWIRVVLCPPGLELDALQQAGDRACDGQVPCGAWIWDDIANAPERAPENHDGLSKAEVTSAKGVWVAEDKTFIQIDKE